MNIYICLKPVALYGVQYEPGDVIPSEAVLPTRIRALKNQGVIIESSLSDKGPSQPGGSTGDGSGVEGGGGAVGGDPDDETAGGADGGHRQIDELLAEGTAALMIQALDNRKALKAAMRSQEKGGAS